MSATIQLEFDFFEDLDGSEATQCHSVDQICTPSLVEDLDENHPGIDNFDDVAGHFVEDRHRVFTVSPGARPQGRDSDTKERISETLKRLRFSGNFRPVRVPDETIDDQLKTLAEEFPNFSHVVQSIVAVHAKMLHRGVRHRMPHLLLTGEPGVGKTKFANALSHLLNAPLLKVDMSTQTNGSTLAGSSVFWSNSSVGSLFSTLAWGCGGLEAAANPVCFVDEFDKAGCNFCHQL